MSIKTTYDIERQTAIAVILSKINNCSNNQIASILLEFDESYFRNYCVSENLPSEDDGYSIKNISEF
jgi:hypothetical protein